MENQIISAVQESLIDKLNKNTSNFNFKILSNNKISMLSTITNLLNNCDEFIFCVAFVKESGIRGLITTLDELERKGIEGKIVIGDMNTFSEPKAIKFLNSKTNIEVKMHLNNSLHTKGYFFRKGDIWTIIVGSSNLTISALKTNDEWNLLLNSFNNGKLVEDVLYEFNHIWDNSYNVDDSIYNYEIKYNEIKTFLLKHKYKNESNTIIPNKMQIEALENIAKVRKNFNKALVISATGTGKTYLAAFDVKNYNPKKMLFIVHNANILNSAKETFETIITNKTMGKYTGEIKEQADYMFCTIQTLSKDEHLNMFDSNEFEYIIIDEVHHAGAKTYQKVLEYFNPKFLFGITATPERSDDFNIYELFDYNIAYEIRLNDAIENDLIVPFHYYGVNEVMINNEIIDSTKSISMKEKARNIIQKSEYYGYDGDKVRGLIFVDNISNANELAIEINKLGYRALSLDSSTSTYNRENAIKLLSSSDKTNYLDFIITFNIFNEGIDIPCVNQVILLRPTNSIIVYIQQLGRGLRKNLDKKYLVVLDFIGSYKNNFLIPLALSGDTTYSVDKLRMFTQSGTDMMPGQCTINFEEISRKEIEKTIDKKKLQASDIIKSNYLLLKQRINKIPMLYDFINNNMLSPERILGYKSNYYEVLKTIDKEYSVVFNEKQIQFINYLHKEFSVAKRVHEILIIKYLLEDSYLIDEINFKIEEYLNINDQINNTINAYDHLSNKIFIKENTRSKFSPLITQNKLDEDFVNYYHNNKEFRLFIDDFIKFNLLFCKLNYKQINKDTLIIHKNYTRKQAYHLLGLDYHAGNQVGGYTVDKVKMIVPIFMSADESSYSNKFINQNEILWFSKNRRSLSSENERDIADNKYTLEVFVKKSYIDSDYYYLGKASVISSANTTNSKGESLVEYILYLDQEVEDVLYRYLVG